MLQNDTSYQLPFYEFQELLIPCHLGFSNVYKVTQTFALGSIVDILTILYYNTHLFHTISGKKSKIRI